MTLPIIAEGKTKIYRALSVEGFHKDDMTAGNGARHEIVPGKGIACNRINDRVMNLLMHCNVPVSYLGKNGDATFIAHASTMLPYEVAVMWEADPKSSLLKRNPDMKPGERFEKPVVQFHLKTSNLKFKGYEVPWDDPIISTRDKFGVRIHDPSQPIGRGDISRFFPSDIAYGKRGYDDFEKMESVALNCAYALDGAFTGQKCKLVDFKIEFDDLYRVSDVLTPDEWRAFDPDGNPLSKQPFRNGASIEEMQGIYAKAVEITSRFC